MLRCKSVAEEEHDEDTVKVDKTAATDFRTSATKLDIFVDDNEVLRLFLMHAYRPPPFMLLLRRECRGQDLAPPCVLRRLLGGVVAVRFWGTLPADLR
jgi:hypothetical protein